MTECRTPSAGLHVTAVTAHIVKATAGYRPVNEGRARGTLPGTDYFRMSPYPQLYPARTESVIVEIHTDGGIVGWGECHAPIGAEVVATAVATVVGPVVLGRDPADVAVLFAEMISTSAVRGHDVGYQADAIAGIDTALWDINGKAVGQAISTLLGGRFRATLPAYASGLRAATPETRRQEALEYTAAGLGVKAFLGADWRAEAREMAELREVVGEEAVLMADALWAYRPAEAAYLGRALQDNGFAFFEAPIAPRDVQGHSRVSAALAIPVAVGELLRGRTEFLPWMQSGAIGVYQPDVMHNGVTETRAISGLAEAFHAPVALHVGASTIIGMAATWQVAAAIPNYLIQEHQPVMFATYNRWLHTPLSVAGGYLQVPDGPGLGIDVDEAAVARDVDGSITITVDGAVTRKRS